MPAFELQLRRDPPREGGQLLSSHSSLGTCGYMDGSITYLAGLHRTLIVSLSVSSISNPPVRKHDNPPSAIVSHLAEKKEKEKEKEKKKRKRRILQLSTGLTVRARIALHLHRTG